MQPLTAPPRDHLDEDAVRALLGAPAVRVEVGADLLRPDLTVAEDGGLTDHLVGGSIERNMLATVHGKATLRLTRALAWGVDLVRPFMVLDDGRTRARWNLGVYTLTSPRGALDTDVREVTGWDRLYLLDRQVGRDYAVEAGVPYLTAIAQVFTDAGLTGILIDSTAAGKVLPARKAWPLVAASDDPDKSTTPVTWLRVLNDLLGAISYRGVWADQDGRFRCESYADPASRGVEWAFDVDDVRGVPVGLGAALVEDTWSTPNRWVLIAANPPQGVVPSEANGLIQVRSNLADGPTSQAPYPAGRGLVWPSVTTVDAADAAALGSLADAKVAADRRTTATFEITTGLFPGAGHGDVLSLVHPDAGGLRKVSATKWTQPLDGGDLSWEWSVII